MIKYNFGINDYAHAVSRELHKREKAYSKMLIKKKKQGYTDIDLLNLSVVLNKQSDALKVVHALLRGETIWLLKGELVFSELLFTELIREYKMRVKCYPRFVKFYKSITQETADYELAVWKELCVYFSQVYMLKDEPETFVNQVLTAKKR